jgi:hypothetical protein
MKKLFLCFVMFISALALFTQPVIQFENTTHDFGTVKEEGGKVTGKFIFSNTGNQDLLLTGVKPGCGCTAADYTKTPVAPGQKGYIDATYNPYNRPGNFNKNIRVTTNEPKFSEDPNTQPYLIYIKGIVEKRAPTKYETAGYKTGTGDVRIKDNSIKVELLNSESKIFTIQVMNFSDKPSIFEPINLPNYITIEKKTTINPGEEVDVNFKYDATKKGEIGNYRDIINIQVDDATDPKIVLILEVVIKEDFSKFSPKQLQDAPRASLDPVVLDFGKVDKNTNPTKEVRLSNAGQNPLIIRQIKSPTTVFSVVSDKMEIPGGSAATLTVTLVSKNRRGVQSEMVEIFTNDPANSTFFLTCKGDISQ